MTAWPRSPVVALVASLACLTLLFTVPSHLLIARDAPAKTVQLPVEVPEPPVVIGPVPALADCLDPPTPVVSLRVRVPACGAAGQELTYRLCVENCSRAAAHHVLVRNPIPANARFVRAKPEPKVVDNELHWPLGTLEPGACCEICLVLCPTGDGDVKSCARVQFEHGQCVTTRIARPALSLKKCAPPTVALYDAVKFELIVCNTGDAPATAVTLTDDLPEGFEPMEGKNPLTWDLGTLAPGQERRVEYQAIAKKAGRWQNRAVVTCAAGLREEASCEVVVAEAKLELAKTGPSQRNVSRPATYQIMVTNAGTLPLANVVITDPVPAKTAFVSATEGGAVTDGVVRWSLGTLPPGARKTVQVVLKAQETGEVVNRAKATADRGVTAEAEARTLFEGGSGLTADVDDKDDPLEVGAQTVYTITVLNQGAVPAKQVVIAATVPAQMEVKGVDGPSASKQEGQKVTFEPTTVQPRAEAVYKITVVAKQPGDVRFRVDLSADPETLPSGLPVRREESTTIFDPNLPNAPPLAEPQARKKGR